MGFPQGYTPATGITERQRQELLGKVMDPHTLQFLMQVCKYMVPVSDKFRMPGPNVPASGGYGGRQRS